ncbi:helix-turn-helix transcriptional regulator [Kangiella sp. HZ709]|uniref:AraC family transcriptional regulator n=1 Tax=Kangiella sp. HZ709 TaxID=2666328 RepID=UPI0012AF0B3B|nr:helix-turn-helix transcriptional regulator [Kangiella sp. HZ709]MRX28166.1 helix-turn-helix domain-containing protein [Kangiella sp. HZ709]
MTIPSIPFKSKQLEALIEIVDLEELSHRKKSLDHNPEKPHKVGFNLLIHVEQGEGAHFLDFNHSHFESGSFIFIRKNQIHAFDLSQNPKGKMILFKDRFIQHIQTNMKIPVLWPLFLSHDYSPIFNPSPSLQQSCQNLIQEIRRETEQGHSNSLIVMHLFSSLFLLMERESKATGKKLLSQQRNEKLEAFMSLVESNYTKTRNASDYAVQLNITYKTLNQLCKNTLGKTAKQLIDSFIILESKRRLILEDKSIQILADELGFDEVTNFVKYFKKHTLMTPSDFKKS